MGSGEPKSCGINEMTMEYEELGNTGLQVSKICLGTMTWGEQNTEAEAHRQLDRALEKGINFIDTAEMYPVPPRGETQGKTEEYIGSWIAARKNREKYILATKVTGPSKFLSYIRDPLRYTPDQIRQALEDSLKRLKTEYIDLYQLHWPERKTNCFGVRGYRRDPADDPWTDNVREVLETLQALINEGKIRFIGLSNETPWGVMRFLQEAREHGLPRIVSIQNPYSLLNRTFEVGLSEMVQREGVSLLAYSPLAFGLLSGKYHEKTATPESRLNQFPDRVPRYKGKRAHEVTGRYVSLARDYGLTPVQMALAFVNSRPFVTSNIIGATAMDQLEENIASLDVGIPEELEKAIEEIHENAPDPAP